MFNNDVAYCDDKNHTRRHYQNSLLSGIFYFFNLFLALFSLASNDEVRFHWAKLRIYRPMPHHPIPSDDNEENAR